MLHVAGDIIAVLPLGPIPAHSCTRARDKALEALKCASDTLAGTLKARGYQAGSDISEWAPEVQRELRALVIVRAALDLSGEARS